MNVKNFVVIAQLKVALISFIKISFFSFLFSFEAKVDSIE